MMPTSISVKQCHILHSQVASNGLIDSSQYGSSSMSSSDCRSSSFSLSFMVSLAWYFSQSDSQSDTMTCLHCGAVHKLSSAAGCLPKLHAVHCILSKPGVELHVISPAPLLLALTHHHGSSLDLLEQLQQCWVLSHQQTSKHLPTHAWYHADTSWLDQPLVPIQGYHYVNKAPTMHVHKHIWPIGKWWSSKAPSATISTHALHTPESF